MAQTSLGMHGQLRVRTAEQRQQVLDAARTMLDKGPGTDLVWREDIYWSDVQPVEGGAYDWTIPDAVVAAAADAGFRSWIVLSHPPAWATAPGGAADKGWPCPPYPDLVTAGGNSALAAYTAFCGAAAARYSRGGVFWNTYDGNPRPATHFEVWNEEYAWIGSMRWNGTTAVPGYSDPEAYAAIFNAAAPAISASLFATPVAALCDQTWNSIPVGGQYLSVFLDELSVPLPAVSIHPYTEGYVSASTAPPSTVDRWKYFTQVQTVRKRLVDEGYGTARIWVTEIGWPGAPSGFLTEQQQAARYQDLWQVVQQLGYVRGLFLFTSTNPDFPDNPALPGYQVNNVETWYGLWRTGADARDLGIPKSAVTAITALPALLLSASTGGGPVIPPAGPCVLDDHFRVEGGAIVVQPWMQWRKVAGVEAASKSGSYAVAGGGNKNDLLQSLTTSYKNTSPLTQYVYGMVSRGGKKMVLQARSRAYFQQLDGVNVGVPVAPATTLPVATNKLVETSRFGCGLDIGNGGVLTTQTAFGIIEEREQSRTRQLMPHIPGWTEVKPGETITARVDVRFKSEYWENWLAETADGSESKYVSGATVLELYAVPKIV